MPRPIMILGVSGLLASLFILDNVTTQPAGAWSVSRRLRIAYTGALIRIRRSSDNAQQDIGYDSGGDLDEAAAATFIGAGTGFIVTIYDQIAAANLTQATAGNQPAYNASIASLNNRPAAVANDTDDRLLATLASPFSGNQDFAKAMVGRLDTSIRGDFRGCAWVGDGSASSMFGYEGGQSGDPWLWGGAFNIGSNFYGGNANANYHYFLHRHASGASTFYVDGVSAASKSCTFSFDAGGVGVGGYDPTGNQGGQFTLSEFMVWAQNVTNGDQTVLDADAVSYYGV